MRARERPWWGTRRSVAAVGLLGLLAVAVSWGDGTAAAAPTGPGYRAAGTGLRAAVAAAPEASSLGPAQVLAPGRLLRSPHGQVTLDMQADGNLVVYSATGAALWSSGTAGHPGAWLAVQDDANLVVYGSGGSALWSSGTAMAFAGTDEGTTLMAGQDLAPGDYLQSPNGRYRLYQTPQGPPALYQLGVDGLWWLMEGSDSLHPAAGTSTFFTCALCTGWEPVRAGSFLILQLDGNLVLYPPGGGAAEWSAGLAGRGGVSLRMQDDGNLVLYRSPAPSAGAALWQSGTNDLRGAAVGQGISLVAGQRVVSPGGRFQLVMQDDGNLVLYQAGLAGALWSSGTQGHPGAYVSMQADGNLVVYQPGPGALPPALAAADSPGDPGTAIWASAPLASFITLPPEINSSLIYAGPGSGPLTTAASAWDAVAGELSLDAGPLPDLLATDPALPLATPVDDALLSVPAGP